MAHLAPEFLAILRCPVTGVSLVQEGAELAAAGKNGMDGPRYTIDAGIPVLLPSAQLTAQPSTGPQSKAGPATTAGSDQSDTPRPTDPPQK